MLSNLPRVKIAFYIFLISTLILSSNPFLTQAQGNQESTVGQYIEALGDAPTILCVHSDFEYPALNINSNDPFFYAYFVNPLTQVTLSPCGGTGITVRDARYNGGFKLQVHATDYVKLGDPTTTIPVTNLGIATQKINPGYNEDTSQITQFNTSSATLVANTTGDNVEAAYPLPFDFTFYNTTYSQGTNIYLCSNGTINFQSGHCNYLPANPEEILTDNTPRIIGYYKDLTTNVSPTGGIHAYQEPTGAYVRFIYYAAPVSAPTELTQFQISLYNDANGDYVAVDFPGSIGDSGTGPVIGVTKGGTIPAGQPDSSVYSASAYSSITAASNVVNRRLQFNRAGFDFSEVKKPSTPDVSAPYNYEGNDVRNATFEQFESGMPIDLLDGTTLTNGGRVGIYTIYPSFKLQIPSATPEGTYQNTITYDVMDSTLNM